MFVKGLDRKCYNHPQYLHWTYTYMYITTLFETLLATNICEICALYNTALNWKCLKKYVWLDHLLFKSITFIVHCSVVINKKRVSIDPPSLISRKILSLEIYLSSQITMKTTAILMVKLLLWLDFVETVDDAFRYILISIPDFQTIHTNCCWTTMK